MKEILKLLTIFYNVSDLPIFEDVNASVHQGERIGVIGKNGAGKSTLLHLLHHDIAPTKGHVQWLQQDLKMTLVEQEKLDYSFEEVTTPEEILLKKMHVPTRQFSHLSGGERLKARLAKGLSKTADVLLVDEPTNHLDEESTDFLIEQMKNYKGTIIFVSHDRYFLDAVATKIWAIEDKRIIEHKGNYSNYLKAREQKRRSQQREYEKQQKMVERIEEQMSELTSWSKKAHTQSTKQEGFKEYHRLKAKRLDSQVKSKRKRLEKELEKAKVEPVSEEYLVEFSITTSRKVGKRFLELKDVEKTFGKRVLFKNVNFTIQYGEKVSLIGPNGSGKTTLLKVILGQESAGGSIWISSAANIGYLTQEVFDLPLEQTPEQLFHQDTFQARGKVQNVMRHLGFSESQWTQPIRNMSMGERVKCKLMAYILEEKDVLILDEPTNHLDLPSREQLEQTLSLYNGTLLIVSHDQYFLEKITNTKLVFSNGSIQKQLKEPAEKRDDLAELRLRLETERQEVLGKLSFITPKGATYNELDLRFKELTKELNDLR